MTDFVTRLDAIVGANHRREERELQAAVRAWVDRLDPVEQAAFARVFLRRLAADPSRVNLSLAAVLPYPGAEEPLAAELARQPEPSPHTRALIAALRAFPGSDTAFRAVERFVDSDQEREALRALAAIDFLRARPHIRQALSRDDLLECCLHLFADRRRAHGIDILAADLRAIAGSPPDWIVPRLDILLHRIKTEAAHPLSPEDRATLSALFGVR
jgi:hypothetical protein